MPISRRLPQTNLTRLYALNAAKAKLDTAPATTVLTAATKARLTAIHTLYNQKNNLLNAAAAQSGQATADKNTAKQAAMQWIVDFFQALIRAIGRQHPGYQNSDKAYYGIPLSSDAGPATETEAEILVAGNLMVDGEDARVAAGGTAIPFPTKVDAKARLDDFVSKNGIQSVKQDALDAAQEALNAQNTEANGVIKKVWDEVETFYNEEPIASKRANAREWGVIYVSDEAATELKLTVVEITAPGADPVAIEGAQGLFIPTDEEGTSDGSGNLRVTVHYEGSGTLRIMHPEYEPHELAVEDLPAEGGVLELGEIALTRT
jgi:hypothetical protein